MSVPMLLRWRLHRHNELSGRRRLRHPHRAAPKFTTPTAIGPPYPAEIAGLDPASRQRQPSPLHGERDLRAAGGRRAYPGALSRHGDRAGRLPDGAAVQFPRAQTYFNRRLRYRLLCWHGARYWFERFAHFQVEVDIASEFRYRDVPLGAGALRSLSRNPARPRIRWRRSVTRANTISTSFPLSMYRRRPSPAKATS